MARRANRYAKHDARAWRDLSDAQLRAWFDGLGNDRVRTGRMKGVIKLRSAKLGDRILDELERRRGYPQWLDTLTDF
jgi:hypothetical protein